MAEGPAAAPEWEALVGARLRLFPFYTSPVVGSVVPLPQHLSCSLGVEQPPHWWASPHATQREVYPQLRWVCPRRWQHRALWCSVRLHRDPQSSVRERSIITTGPRGTETMKWVVRERSFSQSWERRPDRSCITPWTLMPRVASSSWTTLSGMV